MAGWEQLPKEVF
jgi:hypothetical protein